MNKYIIIYDLQTNRQTQRQIEIDCYTSNKHQPIDVPPAALFIRPDSHHLYDLRSPPYPHSPLPSTTPFPSTTKVPILLPTLNHDPFPPLSPSPLIFPPTPLPRHSSSPSLLFVCPFFPSTLSPISAFPFSFPYSSPSSFSFLLLCPPSPFSCLFRVFPFSPFLPHFPLPLSTPSPFQSLLSLPSPLPFLPHLSPPPYPPPHFSSLYPHPLNPPSSPPIQVYFYHLSLSPSDVGSTMVISLTSSGYEASGICECLCKAFDECGGVRGL